MYIGDNLSHTCTQSILVVYLCHDDCATLGHSFYPSARWAQKCIVVPFVRRRLRRRLRRRRTHSS